MIDPKLYTAYAHFVRTYCPKKNGETILCKDCDKWKGRCRHIYHPLEKLFPKENKPCKI